MAIKLNKRMYSQQSKLFGTETFLKMRAKIETVM